MVVRLSSRNKRGGVTAIVGWLLVGLGAVGTFQTLSIVYHSLAQMQTATAVPLPSFEPALAFATAALCIGLAGGGVLLIGFARGERDREEEIILDPLKYAPFRHPWRRVLPWFVFVIVALLIPSLFFLPVPHAISFQFPVSNCPGGAPGPNHSLTIPSGTVLAYHWSTSDGLPVSEVWAPSGPVVSSDYVQWGLTAEFLNSSYGNSVVQGNGSAVSFWACEPAASSPANLTIDISGTYYTWIL